MKIPLQGKVAFCLIVALSLMDLSCATSTAYVSPTAKNPPVNGRKAYRGVVGRTSSHLVGIWQGFWSLKGRVATDQFLFLEDGRWGWLATADTKVTSTVQPVQRSGRWEMEAGIVVLTELQRKEIVGCKPDPSSDRTRKDISDCKPYNAEYRTVRHDTPIIERLAIGECPANQEAKMIDREYTCLSIGERIFWRKSIPAKREQNRFFEGE